MEHTSTSTSTSKQLHKSSETQKTSSEKLMKNVFVETNLKKVTHEIVIADEASILSRKSVAEVYKGNLKMKNQNVATVN